MKISRETRIDVSDEEGRSVHLWETDGWTHITCKVGGEWIVRAHASSRDLAIRGAEKLLEMLKERMECHGVP